MAAVNIHYKPVNSDGESLMFENVSPFSYGKH
jgi:hypothetical protein